MEKAHPPSKAKRKRPRSHIIISNISKYPNIKTLLKTSVAFGCQTIFVAGQKNFNFDYTTEKHHIPQQIIPSLQSGKVQIMQFDKLKDCVDHLHSQNIKVVGVEIDESAIDIDQPEECFNDCEDVAFMMGNEGQGMNSNQMKLCDKFVKISQFGGGTASLNVSVAAGIVLHRFYEWSLSTRK